MMATCRAASRRTCRGEWASLRAILKQKPAPGVHFASEVPEPTPGEGEVLVEVAATSICGTDLHLYEWTASARAFQPTLPLVMGHESAGRVVAAGPGVSCLQVGDRVAAESHLFCGACYFCGTGDAHNCPNLRILGLTWDGAFAEYFRVPERACFSLPDSIPLELGALFEPCGVAVHALQRAGGGTLGASVLISGAGPIGLCLIQLCLAGGAARVVAIEPNRFRRRLAEDLGAQALDPGAEDAVALARRLNPRRGGFDLAFECSGAEPAIATLMAALRREGTLVTVGHPAAPVAVDVAAHLNKQGIVWKGVFGRRIWESWELLLALVESGRLDLGRLVTHRLGLEEFERAVRLLREDAAKILVLPR